MLRIRVRSGIGQYHAAGDAEGTLRNILRRDVELLDANGMLVAKINVPSAERIAQAFKSDEDGETLSDLGDRIAAAVVADSIRLAEVVGSAKVGRKTRTVVRPLTETNSAEVEALERTAELDAVAEAPETETNSAEKALEEAEG